MADSGNTSFLARHLLRSEFPRGEFTDVKGGCLIADDAAWLGVTAPELVPDAEALLKQAQAFAKERNLPWAGAVLFTSAASAPPPEVEALEEALYIYSYQRAKGLNRGGPDIVHILPNEPRLISKPAFDIEPASANLDAASHLYALASQTADKITGPAWNRSKGWIERADPWVLYRDFSPAGLISYIPGELIGRVVMLVVADEHRGHGVGRELLSHAQSLGIKTGSHFTSVWNYREGKLRYYIAKQGFTEQLGVRYFLAGQPE